MNIINTSHLHPRISQLYSLIQSDLSQPHPRFLTLMSRVTTDTGTTTITMCVRVYLCPQDVLLSEGLFYRRLKCVVVKRSIVPDKLETGQLWRLLST